MTLSRNADGGRTAIAGSLFQIVGMLGRQARALLVLLTLIARVRRLPPLPPTGLREGQVVQESA